MKFSWDDNAFGLATEGSSVLTYPLVNRPSSCNKSDWYKFASDLQSQLNDSVKDVDVEVVKRIKIEVNPVVLGRPKGRQK